MKQSKSSMNEIVNEVESEYGGGWIPCSERLPEDDNSELYKVVKWQPLPEPYKPKFEFKCANPPRPELIAEVHNKLRKIEPYKAESEG